MVDRSEIGELKLYGMKAAFDEIITTSEKRHLVLDDTPLDETLVRDMPG